MAILADSPQSERPRLAIEVVETARLEVGLECSRGLCARACEIVCIGVRLCSSRATLNDIHACAHTQQMRPTAYLLGVVAGQVAEEVMADVGGADVVVHPVEAWWLVVWRLVGGWVDSVIEYPGCS